MTEARVYRRGHRFIDKLPAQTEVEFQKQVVALARLLGWADYHTQFSIRSARGWPDLALCRIGADGVGRLIFLELKAERGKITDAQQKWLSLLSQVPGVDVRCLRPSDWDELVKLLT